MPKIIAIINPGSGPVNYHTADHARANMLAFVEALYTGKPAVNGDARLKFRRAVKRDYGQGRYCFILTGCNAQGLPVRLEIQMPGAPLKVVTGSVLQAPRLYVDGESWFWEFALLITRKAFIGEDEK